MDGATPMLKYGRGRPRKGEVRPARPAPKPQLDLQMRTVAYRLLTERRVAPAAVATAFGISLSSAYRLMNLDVGGLG